MAVSCNKLTEPVDVIELRHPFAPVPALTQLKGWILNHPNTCGLQDRATPTEIKAAENKSETGSSSWHLRMR